MCILDFVVVLGGEFRELIFVVCVGGIIRNTVHQLFSILFGGGVNRNPVRASWNGELRVRLIVGIFN